MGRALNLEDINLFTKDFFSTHANPYLLNFKEIIEIFNKLDHNIDCKFDNKHSTNVIIINKRTIESNSNTNNIIQLPTKFYQ